MSYIDHVSQDDVINKYPSWKDIADNWKLLVSLLSVYAFVYVIGYFYAFNILWFPFFTFTDHLVFALRALPAAAGASILFLIGLSYIHAKKLQPPEERRRRLPLWLTIPWALIIFFVACVLAAGNHIAPAFCLFTIVAGMIFFQVSSGPILLSTRVLFWAANLMVVCLMVGFVNGELSKHLPKYLSVFPHADLFPFVSSSMYVVSNKPPEEGSIPLPAGHVIFTGSNGVLIYDYACGRARLARWDEIDEIAECREATCQTERPLSDPLKECYAKAGSRSPQLGPSARRG